MQTSWLFSSLPEDLNLGATEKQTQIMKITGPEPTFWPLGHAASSYDGSKTNSDPSDDNTWAVDLNEWIVYNFVTWPWRSPVNKAHFLIINYLIYDARLFDGEVAIGRYS